MKRNRYRRLRAKEMATRDFCAGRTSPGHNPFPADTVEHRVWQGEISRSVAFDGDMAEMFEVYGGQMPQRRDPATVSVRPALPGCP